MRRTTILFAVALLMVAACGDDSTETVPLESTTTTQVVAASTTTSTMPATTVPETSTSTAPPPTLGPPPLPQVVFQPDGLEFAGFGDDPDVVLNIAQILWGPSAADTGILSSIPNCPGTQYRKVSWESASPAWNLFLLFTDDDAWTTPGGALVFSGYGYTSPVGHHLTAGPPVSIDAGVSVADLESLWPGVGLFESEFSSDLMFQHSPTGYSSGVVLMGRVTGLTGAHAIIDVYGGKTCYGDAPGLD
jgi:hypothetical protein